MRPRPQLVTSDYRPAHESTRVLIVGSGFGGIGLALQLRRAGIEDFVILEQADEVGGCWRDNPYPGAACDVPSHLYSFSFAPNPGWSRRYAPQGEIFAYLKQCARVHGLYDKLRFGQQVTRARFDEASGHWLVDTASGERFVAQVFVCATGQLNRPLYPKLEGLSDFAGPSFHSARWQHDAQLDGKRIGVIGTGASAIQFVPELAARASQLTVFQRSAAYVIPKLDRAYSQVERALYRTLPRTQSVQRAGQYVAHEAMALAFMQPALMKRLRFLFERHLESQVADPALRAKLTPDYPFGCKRILISNDYFPAIARPNVELVDTPIERVTRTGIITADGRERELDVLVFGTGFRASEFLAPMQVEGLHGADLQERWQAGAEAHLGITISGFPNLFMLYGPNTNLGHNSIVYMLESQIRYVLGCLQVLEQKQLRYMDVHPHIQEAFNKKVQAQLQQGIWSQGCSSWYQTDSGKHTNNWPGFTFTYRNLTRTPNLGQFTLIPSHDRSASLREA